MINRITKFGIFFGIGKIGQFTRFTRFIRITKFSRILKFNRITIFTRFYRYTRITTRSPDAPDAPESQDPPNSPKSPNFSELPESPNLQESPTSPDPPNLHGFTQSCNSTCVQCVTTCVKSSLKRFTNLMTSTMSLWPMRMIHWWDSQVHPCIIKSRIDIKVKHEKWKSTQRYIVSNRKKRSKNGVKGP